MRDENLLAGMKMFRETLTFRETSRKILDINVPAALMVFAPYPILRNDFSCRSKSTEKLLQICYTQYP